MAEDVNNLDGTSFPPNPYGAAESTASEAEAAPAAQHARRRRGRGRTFNSANLVLTGLFGAGMLGLYLLSLRGLPAAASAEQQATEQQVDSALQKLNQPSNAAQNRATDVVSTFYYEAKQRQVPVEQLGCNPFVFKAPPRPELKESPEKPVAPPPVDDENRPQSDALKAASSLTLQSVLMGTHGATAIVSNNLLTEGQTIHGWTVKSIGPREVVLTWKDQTYVLKMP